MQSEARNACRKIHGNIIKSAVGTTDVLSLLQSFSLLWFNILRKFRAIALHYPPMFCRSYGT